MGDFSTLFTVQTSPSITTHTNFVMMIPMGFVYSMIQQNSLTKIDRGRSKNDNDDRSRREELANWSSPLLMQQR